MGFIKVEGTDHIQEHVLLQRSADGDSQAFELLYTRYLPKLYHYIYRFTSLPDDDIMDICQDLFLKLWDRKELLITIRSLDVYLKRSGKNALLDRLKHGQFKVNLHKQYSLGKEEHRATTEELLQFSEYSQLAQQAILQLSPRKQEIFRLRMEQDMSLDEIAEFLHISKSRVKQSIYEAKDEIRLFLKQRGGLFLIIFFLHY
ncbi:RNA polymerase sigma factor [Chitinophaga sp. Cy-1792]|uniref:RNA polymerase sigma factor n=1 Tax=Chitinophaga sp. Cy-1792 TaxID=2608339 RepID=UPI00141DE482|nr:sigma-70 family RNA polymerase sigma factor [Chitinophaga sp. Cy-1792]